MSTARGLFVVPGRPDRPVGPVQAPPAALAVLVAGAGVRPPRRLRLKIVGVVLRADPAVDTGWPPTRDVRHRTSLFGDLDARSVIL